jgi:hypothetical protein
MQHHVLRYAVEPETQPVFRGPSAQ